MNKAINDIHGQAIGPAFRAQFKFREYFSKKEYILGNNSTLYTWIKR